MANNNLKLPHFLYKVKEETIKQHKILENKINIVKNK